MDLYRGKPKCEKPQNSHQFQWCNKPCTWSRSTNICEHCAIIRCWLSRYVLAHSNYWTADWWSHWRFNLFNIHFCPSWQRNLTRENNKCRWIVVDKILQMLTLFYDFLSSPWYGRIYFYDNNKTLASRKTSKNRFLQWKLSILDNENTVLHENTVLIEFNHPILNLNVEDSFELNSRKIS